MSDPRILTDDRWEETAALAISDQPEEYRENCIAWLRWDREARKEQAARAALSETEGGEG